MRRVLVAAVCLALVSACSPLGGTGAADPASRLFEGARLVTGNGSAPIETSAFIVQNNQFTQVGRRGEVQVPPGAARVDLTGKTVMPTLVDLHGHVGFQNVAEGTMSKETFTRDNLIDHLELLAYNGVGAVIGVGDLISRSDLHGGRTDWGRRALRFGRNRARCSAGFGRQGPGIACRDPGRRATSRTDGSYPVSDRGRGSRGRPRLRPHEAGVHQDLGGRPRRTKKTLTPPLYRAMLTRRISPNVPVGRHNVTLATCQGDDASGRRGLASRARSAAARRRTTD